ERRQAVTLGAASVALAYLNHFGMVYAAMLFAMLFATFRGDRTVRPHIARLAAVCAIAYAPIVPFLYLQLKYNIDGWQPYQVGTFLANLTPSLFFNDPTVVWLALAVLALTLVARAARDRRVREQLRTIRNRHIVFIVVAFGTFMLVLGAVRPIFYVRYFLAMMPAVLLGLAVATAAAFPLDRRWAAIALLAFCSRAAVTQFRTIDALQREQWDKSVDLVLASHAPADAIYVLGASMDKTEFDYLRSGDVDGVFNVRNLKFYRYYFRRRGAAAVAAQLNVAEPTVESAKALGARFHDTGATIYVLAAHHLQYPGDALATL